jgi:hypothetical protein
VVTSQEATPGEYLHSIHKAGRGEAVCRARVGWRPREDRQ